MKAFVGCAAVVAVGLLSIGCSSGSPSAPAPAQSATSPPATTSASAPSTTTTTFPAPSGSSRTFAFERPLSYPVSKYTTESRFVLYDDGAFVLQYSNQPGPDGYAGGYTDANGVLTMQWEGWSLAGPWGATATLNGDTLTVKYNVIMQLTDFEDAVYTRVP